MREATRSAPQYVYFSLSLSLSLSIYIYIYIYIFMYIFIFIIRNIFKRKGNRYRLAYSHVIG